MGIIDTTKILTYEKGYIAVSDLWTRYQSVDTNYQIWNGVSWSLDYTMTDPGINVQTNLLTTTNQLQVQVCDNQEILIGGANGGAKTFTQLTPGDPLVEYTFPLNMNHLTDPDTVVSPLSEGLFMISGGQTYKGHNIVQLNHAIAEKMPEITGAVYADIFADRQTVIFLDSMVQKGISWVPIGYSTATKLEWLQGIFYVVGNLQSWPFAKSQMIAALGPPASLTTFRNMQLAMHEMGVNSHIVEYIQDQNTPNQCTSGDFVDPICAFEFLRDYNNISLNDGDVYYLIFTGISSTERLLEAGFKQSISDQYRNKNNLNVTQWTPIHVYSKVVDTVQHVYTIDETRAGHFLANGILLKSQQIV